MRGVWAAAAVGQFTHSAPPPRQMASAVTVRSVVDKYCVTCHNEKLKTGGLTLDTLDLAAVGAHPEIGEKLVRKLRSGMMPPLGRPRPDQKTYDEVRSWLEGELDR